MEFLDRKLESKIVKEALKANGIKASVTHGTGTARSWLHIRVYPGIDWNTVIKIAQEATKRTGSYDGRINVYSSL